jgi:Raf kinase inhibitor-like YbhB/YbcL family protein
LCRKDEEDMKRLLIAVSIAAFALAGSGQVQAQPYMQLEAADFHYLGKIPTEHGAGLAFGPPACPGTNEPITFNWSNVPGNAVSLAITIVDYTIPFPRGYFAHWIAYNIPPTATGIGPATMGEATQGTNDAGIQGYAGPCPPDIPPQPHVYTMTLYALDETGLPAGMTFDQFQATMAASGWAHELAVAYYAGTYAFQKVKPGRFQLFRGPIAGVI